MDEREGDDADVDAAAFDVQREPAVLGCAALGDVEVGHDLDARDHPGGHPAAHGRGGVEDAVDPEQDTGVSFLGVDVDVGGALLDGLRDDRVHELDDRGVLVGLLGERGLQRPALVVVDDVFDRALQAPEAGREQVDVLGRGRRDAHAAVGDHRDVVDAEDVRRVGHRQQQRAVVGEGDGDRLVALDGLGAEQVDGAHVGLVDGEVDVVQAEAFGDDACELVLAQDALLDEHLPGGLALRARGHDGLLDGVAVGEAEIDDDLPDPPPGAPAAERGAQPVGGRPVDRRGPGPGSVRGGPVQRRRPGCARAPGVTRRRDLRAEHRGRSRRIEQGGDALRLRPPACGLGEKRPAVDGGLQRCELRAATGGRACQRCSSRRRAYHRRVSRRQASRRQASRRRISRRRTSQRRARRPGVAAGGLLSGCHRRRRRCWCRCRGRRDGCRSGLRRGGRRLRLRRRDSCWSDLRGGVAGLGRGSRDLRRGHGNRGRALGRGGGLGRRRRLGRGGGDDDGRGSSRRGRRLGGGGSRRRWLRGGRLGRGSGGVRRRDRLVVGRRAATSKPTHRVFIGIARSALDRRGVPA